MKQYFASLDVEVYEESTHHKHAFRFAKCIADLAKRHNARIVHANGRRAFLYAMLARLFHPKFKLVVTEHLPFFSIHKLTLYNLKQAIALIAHTLPTHLADRVICVSDYIRNEKTRYQLVPRHKLVTVYNGVDFSRAKPTGRDVRKEFGIAADDFVIAQIARIEHHKGQSVLLKATSLLIEKNIPLKILIVGTGSDEARLRKLAVELGLGKRVIFTGFQQNVADFFIASDAIALPSEDEGFPLSLIESCYFERPAIVTPVSGMPEIIVDGVNGFHVPVARPDLLAEAIQKLRHDRGLRERMGKTGRRMVEERFSLDAMLSVTMKVYRCLLRIGGK